MHENCLTIPQKWRGLCGSSRSSNSAAFPTLSTTNERLRNLESEVNNNHPFVHL